MAKDYVDEIIQISRLNLTQGCFRIDMKEIAKLQGTGDPLAFF